MLKPTPSQAVIHFCKILVTTACQKYPPSLQSTRNRLPSSITPTPLALRRQMCRRQAPQSLMLNMTQVYPDASGQCAMYLP